MAPAAAVGGPPAAASRAARRGVILPGPAYVTTAQVVGMFVWGVIRWDHVGDTAQGGSSFAACSCWYSTGRMRRCCAVSAQK
jgi:hypothetical protein